MAAATSPSRLSAVLLTVAALLPAEPAAQSVSTGRLSADLVRKVEQVAERDVSSELKTAARAAAAEALRSLYSSLTPRVSEASALPDGGSGADAAVEGTRHALLVGNGDYQHLPDLSTAKDDAKAVADVLALEYGFEVLLLLDANRYQILSALNRLHRQLSDRDSLVIYYAGHSEIDRVAGRCFWLPVDAMLESSSQWISTIELSGILDAMEARHVLVLANSCVGGVADDGSVPVEEVDDPNSWSDMLAAAGQRSRIAASGGGLAPIFDGSGHSIFASGLLEALKQNEGAITGPDLAREIARLSKFKGSRFRFEQDPYFGSLRFAGHEAGELVLFKAPSDGTILEQSAAPSPAAPEPDGSAFLVVDCLLPAQPKRLGATTTFLAQRRPARSTAEDCERRGGEYVAYPRDDPTAGLRIWLETAEAGDPNAQTRVGEIYERAEDYGEAASWYMRAADEGYARAQVNLASLHRRGLGVPQSDAAALRWYRRALLSGDQLAAVEAGVTPVRLGQLNRGERAAVRRAIDELETQDPADGDEPYSPSDPRAESPDEPGATDGAGPEITLVDPVLPDPATPGVVVRTFPGHLRHRIVGRVASLVPVLSISVNGRAQPFNEEHVFAADIDLKPDGTRVRIIAVDEKGRRSALDFVLIPSPPPEPTRGELAASFETVSLTLPDAKRLVQAVPKEQASFMRPAFQCLDDLRICRGNGYGWLDCELTMVVCVLDVVLE